MAPHDERTEWNSVGDTADGQVLQADIIDLHQRRHQQRTDEMLASAPEPVATTEDDAISVPVDPPTIKAGTYSTILSLKMAKRQPIIAPWLASKAEFAQTSRWAVRHAGHTVAFHTVRLPIYASKLALRAPIGLIRAITGVSRWMFDAEGMPVRAAAVDRKDAELYMKLMDRRNDRVRLRVMVVAGAGIGALIALGLILFLTPGWLHALGFVAAIAGLGVWATPADKPVLGAAVVRTQTPRLTSELVIRALGALGIAEINKVLAKGGRIHFPAPITRDGPGWRADVDLPYGVTAVDIIERRDRLASGLRRPLGCVWPEPASDEHAGRLVLWVGDADMSQAKPKPWPLLRSGRANLFEPVPFGMDQRGRLISVLLMFANVLIGAMPRQGKTFAMRVLLLAAALDPLARLSIWELKGTGDLSALEKVSHDYGSGADDETIGACVDSLRTVYAELDKRAKTIAGLPKAVCPENKVTPELASRKSLGLFPLVIGIDECQELFSHPEFGKEADRLCTAIIKRGPALGIILILATQRPDKDSLPTGVSANVGIRFCLRVMGQTENDMVLGTSAYKNGIRASMLTNKDKGIGYLLGASDDPQIVRSSYLDGPTAELISVRACAAREAAGTLSGHARGDIPQRSATQSSILDDVLAVVSASEPKIWSETVVSRLAEYRPEAYTNWKAEHLAAALKPFGVPVGRQVWGTDPDSGKGANRKGIHRTDILSVVTERDKRRESH